MGVTTLTFDVSKVVKTHFTQYYNEEDIVIMSPYWHDLVLLLAHAIVRGGFLSGEVLLDVNGEVLLAAHWDEFIDNVYDEIILTIDDLPISEQLNWDSQGRVEVMETVVLCPDDYKLPILFSFKLMCMQEYSA